jgi:tubby-related protein 1
MTVLLPRVDKEGGVSEWKPTKVEDHLLKSFRRGCISRITPLVNKMPTWNSSLKAYVLDFGGRVTLPSVKNFQLTDTSFSLICFKVIGNIVMQFGRIDENIFNVDFRWPLSIFQAYGIAISSFSHKYTFPITN